MAELQKVIKKQNRYGLWLVPVIVLLVVAATIYLSVINNKIEYVYSLATASFGYYFGAVQRVGNIPEQKPPSSFLDDENNSS